MNVYKVSPNGDLVTPIDLLRKLAQTKNSENNFELHAEVKFCYKIGRDGKVSWEPKMIISDADGQVSEFDHLGFGEDNLFTHLFSIGGDSYSGAVTTFDYTKFDSGFLGNPDLFRPKQPPPPPSTGQLSNSEKAKMEEEQQRIQTPSKVKMNG
jgi:hypothetical protein